MAPLLRPFVLATVLLSGALAGCTDKLSFNSATVEEPAFDVQPEKGDEKTVFRVDASDLADEADLSWDWGDGTTSKGASAEHKYGFTNGVMTITLLATGKDGKQGIASRTVTLGSGANRAPTVSISASTSWTEVRRTVNLSASGYDGDRDPLAYLWSYTVVSGGKASDGHDHSHATGAAPTTEELLIEGTGARTSVLFDAPGEYLVKVRAKDPKGAEAVSTLAIDVSKKIPDSLLQIPFTGTLTAGNGGLSVSEHVWNASGQDTFVDSARHRYTLLYPASTFIVLTWNDTSNASLYDLDMELRNLDTNQTVFRSERHLNPSTTPPTPAPSRESNATLQPPGRYEVIVRAYAGAQVSYKLLVSAYLRITPELVAQVEGT